MIDTSISVIPSPQHSGGGIAGWVAQACPPGARVLNIGAGSGLSGALKPLSRRSAYMVGVDPDPTVHANPILDERFQMSLEEFTPTHEGSFDVAFAVYVLEHVSRPEEFIASCAQVLRPGGSLFGLTLNMYQYFGAMTWAATRLGVSDWLLRRLKDPEEVGRYHFPTEYRLNSIRSLSTHLDAAGFGSVEFRCYEDTERYAWYLPSYLQWFAPAYTRAAYAIAAPRMMGHLSFRAVK